jgi:DNA-binding response OmpR family regulator
MPKNILIVEDDPDMVELLRLALSGEDYNIYAAVNGLEGLTKARVCPPDLVLLDLLLPELNGFDVCERLRSNPATAFIPIIMITGLPGELPRVAGVEAGADLYIRKPLDIPDLVSRVREMLDPTPARRHAARDSQNMGAEGFSQKFLELGRAS